MTNTLNTTAEPLIFIGASSGNSVISCAECKKPVPFGECTTYGDDHHVCPECVFSETPKPAPASGTPRSLADVIVRLTAAVSRAQVEEVALNRHLGRSASYQRGSLSVSMRWDDLATLLHGLKSNAPLPP